MQESLGGEDPLEKQRHPTPVLLPGEFHGQTSLAGQSAWGLKQSGTGLTNTFPCLELQETGKQGLSWTCEGGLKVLVTQSCPTLWDPMDCSPPGSPVRGILQARILECIAIYFSRETSWPRDQTHVSCIAGGFFTVLAPGKPNHGHTSEILQVWFQTTTTKVIFQ